MERRDQVSKDQVSGFHRQISRLPMAASIAILISMVSSGCRSSVDDQNLLKEKQSTEEALRKLDEERRREEEAEKRLDQMYKDASPEQAKTWVGKAKDKSFSAERNGGVLDREMARKDLQGARRACRLAREGYREKNGTYPDLDCEE